MKFSIILFVQIWTYSLVSQSQPREIYGTFVLEEEVYQYKFKKTENGIHSLRIYTLGNQSAIDALDAKKLDSTVKFLTTELETKTKGLNKSSIDFFQKNKDLLIGKSIQDIKNKKSNWESSAIGLKQISDSISKYKLDNTNTNGTYTLAELIDTYSEFWNRNTSINSSSEIPFYEYKANVFESIFIKEMRTLKPSLENDEIKNMANNLFIEIKTRINFEESSPATAYLTLKNKKIMVRTGLFTSYKCADDDKCPKFHLPFIVDKCVIEFEDGTMKNIYVDLLPDIKEYRDIYLHTPIQFRNNVPISITGKFDPEKFKNNVIYAGNTRELMIAIRNGYPNLGHSRKKPINPFNYNKEAHVEMWFQLSDLLDYKVIAENENEDYSPANSRVELSEIHPIITLYKEKRSNILTARAFTDLRGLSDNQPNGLVQIEVSKKVNFLTSRSQGILSKIGKRNTIGLYSGYLTYVEPKIIFSKIEENNSYLSLDSFDLKKVESFQDSTAKFNLNAIEVLNFQNFSAGIGVNVWKVNLQNRKINLQLNYNFNYGITSTKDSVQIRNNSIVPSKNININSINTLAHGPSAILEWKPDSRYGFNLGYELKWVRILNNRYYLPNTAELIHSPSFSGHLNLNSNSKMFFRYKFFWLNSESERNFYQLQLGYELDLFRTGK